MSHKIEKFTTVWAESGTTTPAPTTEKKELGFVDDDRPAHERFNFLQNRAENKLNDLAVERVSSTYEDATDAALMISTGLFEDSWGMSDDTANIIDGGATKAYRALSSFFTSTGEPRLLVADDTNMKIEVRDPRALTLVDTSDALTDDLPAAGATWEILSMATDGTYVYLAFCDQNAAPDVYRIQAWQISDWSVRTGWAATGTALTTTGTHDHYKGVQIIVASATKLAIVHAKTTVNAATSPAIEIIDITDGTIDASGAGDCPTGVSAIALDAICSDGTNVFFVAANVGGSFQYLCSVTIANPQVGCGGANFPLTLPSARTDEKVSLVACGPNLMVLASSSDSIAVTDVILFVFNATDADLDRITYGQDSAASPAVGEHTILAYPSSVCFDGINIYIFSKTTVSTAMITKIDVGRLLPVDVAFVRQLGDVMTGSYFIENSVAGVNYQCCVFDGRDVWVNHEALASQTYSGKLYRLPLALLRS